MQAAGSKDKRRRAPDDKRDDPDYENITSAFRSQDKPPKNQGRSRSPPGGDQAPPWLYRVLLSVYALLALAFIFCIILSALVLVKSHGLSWELQNLNKNLNEELWNVSKSVKDCQASLKWDIQKGLIEVKNAINHRNEKLKMVPEDLMDIKNNLQKVLQLLQQPLPRPTAQ
ncbi:PREDICTED: mast cell-expressed membrane protein 1 [Condylura cristata]|uniref:mast cell-expressed membrane protein 1 n=1 Tax=Condylura cristata TaxID=143302 RepID=UPI00064305B5|nr:PREDICTED: mast cell-expressed membrane protein 1 [Condylura cristata]